jgi:ribosomal-protein-alanine N-acetyltransferase
MIRPFSLSDLESILQIENQSFPKSPYDWTTFLNLHYLYPETFLVHVNPSTPQPEASDSPLTRDVGGLSRAAEAEGLRVDPEQRLPFRSEERGLGAVERANAIPGQKEEQILGYVVFSQDGHIISIAVLPQYRRKGIGTQLLQRVMKTPRIKKVWAEVRRSNQGAQAFYSKMGFEITDRIPNYYGNEDALIVQWIPTT